MSTNTDVIYEFYSELAESPIVMMVLPGQDAIAEPMTVYFDEALPNQLFIYTRKDNRLVERMNQRGTTVSVQFSSKGNGFFAWIRAEVSRLDDPAMIDRFWSPEVSAWFAGGRTDSTLQMLQVDLHDAVFWRAETGMGKVIKQSMGADLDRSVFEGQAAARL